MGDSIITSTPYIVTSEDLLYSVGFDHKGMATVEIDKTFPAMFSPKVAFELRDGFRARNGNCLLYTSCYGLRSFICKAFQRYGIFFDFY